MAGTASPIDQHRFIVLLHIESANPSAWSPDTRESDPQPMSRRDVQLSARVLRVLKPPADQVLPGEIDLKVEQRQPESGIIADDYGPWSAVDLAPGVELLVFADEPGQDTPIGRTLAEGTGLLIDVASPQTPYAVTDVERVLGWEQAVQRRPLESDEIRPSIEQQKAESGPLLAGHLMASLEGGNLADSGAEQTHRFLLDLLKAPDAQERFRLVILNHEINTLLMADPPPPWFRAELIAAMLHLLEGDAELLHGPIRQAYLVNAVFDAAGNQLLSAQDVVPDAAQRAAFATLVEQRSFEPEQEARLTNWLRAE